MILIEVGVVTCLGLVPPTVHSLYIALNRDAVRTSFAWDMWLLFASALQVAVPLLYIVWRSGESWAEFGIRRPQYFLDPLIGIAVLGAAWIVFKWVTLVAAPLIDANTLEEVTHLFATPQGPGSYVFLAIVLIANALSEELLVRAYLLTRLRHLGLATVPAVLVSSALWAGYHTYQGAFYATSIFFTGLGFGVVFVVTRRIWPLVIAHALYGFLAYIRLVVS